MTTGDKMDNEDKSTNWLIQTILNLTLDTGENVLELHFQFDGNQTTEWRKQVEGDLRQILTAALDEEKKT
jgi:hypothetical protein